MRFLGLVLASLLLISATCRPGPAPFEPESVHLGTDGILYMYAPDKEAVYRYLVAEDRYVPKIPIGSDSRDLTYVTDHNALYVARSGLQIDKIDLTVDLPVPEPFVEAPGYVEGLGATPSFLVVETPNRIRTFGADGSQADESYGAWNNYKPPTWDPVRSRLYWLSGTSPSDIVGKEIDPVTGQFGGGVATPYHGEFPLGNTIRVSKDGTEVLVGAQRFFDADTLEIQEALPQEAEDALWLDDGGLITIAATGWGQTWLNHWDADRVLFNSQLFPGTPIRVFEAPTPGAYLVVSQGSRRPKVSTYVPTDDPDADGVPNPQDAFPLDPAAAEDSDRDGFPDAWNPGMGPDDSIYGLALDAYPLDSACWLPEHGTGGVCDIAGALPAYDPARIVMGADDLVYLLSPENRRIYRWSVSTGVPLNPIVTGPDPTLMAYSQVTHRLYVGYPGGAITQIELASSVVEEPFTVVFGNLHGLATANEFVLAADSTGYDSAHYTFAPGGEWLSWDDRKYTSADYEWSPANGRMYFFRGTGSPPEDIRWEGIDTSTGELDGSEDSSFESNWSLGYPLRASPDGSRVLLGTGVFRDGTTLDLLGSLAVDPVDAVWLADGGLLTLRPTGADDTLIEQWDAAFALVTQRLLPGAPLRVLEWNAGFVVVTSVGGKPEFHLHQLGADGDGDGVPSPEDAFPLDPAASLDSDGDGRPDAWNPGMGPGDSTTGLVLDAFPLDSACWLPEHGTGGVCDIAGAIPSYDPADIAMGADDVLYLFSPENRRIYRWSAAAEEYLNPIVIGAGATHMAYSATAHRLFLAYPSGAITQIDLASSLAESPYSAAYTAPSGLATAGEFVVAVHRTSGWAVHYSFHPDGSLISFDELNYDSRAFGWSSVNRRLYYFGDSTSSEPMASEEIAPDGSIVDRREGESYSGLPLEPPIRPSPDATRVLIGTGQLYDGETLAAREALPEGVTDAHWLADGRLLTVREDGAGGTLAAQRGPDLYLWQEDVLPGAPRRVLEWSGGTLVVTWLGGAPAFHSWEPLDDADGDGWDNFDDAFPTDPAAALDTDGDGGPDEWNPGMGPGDSTTGLVLDAFPLDFACQLPEHGVGGICDFELVIPSDPATPLCDQDDLGAFPASGALAVEPVSDFVPLCSGWLLYGDRDGYRIVAREVASGRVGLAVPLSGKPGDLELDAEAKVLHVALPQDAALAAVDLVTGEAETRDLPGGFPRQLSLGNGGDLWLLSYYSGHDYLVRTLNGGSSIWGSWLVTGTDRFVYNRTRDEITTGGLGSSALLRRYAWNGVSLLELETNHYPGYQGNDMALSPDSQHLAFACDSYEGGAAATDWSPADVNVLLGIFQLDAPAEAVAFGPASQQLAIGTDTALSIWGTADYAEMDSLTLPACSSGLTAAAGVSRGGGLAFAQQDCGYQHTSTNLHWLRVD
jgi:hypothetical protein